MTFEELCKNARAVSRALAITPRTEKDAALLAASAALLAHATHIASENDRDVHEARARGTSAALLDRLVLDVPRIESVARSLQEIAAAHDHVGAIIEDTTRPSGLRVRRVRVPIGVIGMIYEARPNVTAEAFALCFKSGNAVILRGGSDASRTNVAIANTIRDALPAKLRDALQLADASTRDSVLEMIRAEGAIDLVIPRGGESLIRFVTDNARVPVIQHYQGVCHLYVDGTANIDDAIRLTVNAKLSRPGVCNALECLLVDESIASKLLPPLAIALDGCELRGDEKTCAIIPTAIAANPADYGHEFLERILAIRVVANLDAALEHIARYGSSHTESICTRDEAHAARFRAEVDAACVIVNASTRFHDGGELGLGAEIGIATSRLHWRGPMGLESLTTTKWLLDGAAHTR